MTTSTDVDDTGTVDLGLLRVTVTSGERRADLALPATVPVAELLPELVRSLGLLDAQIVHAGFGLVTSDGRELAPDTGLLAQGVADGAHLGVRVGADERPPRVYDDVVEAMSDAVEEDMAPWRPEASRRTALGTAALLLLIGAVALASMRPSVVAAASAGVVALLLVVGAVVLSQLREEDEVAVVLGWLAGAYAAAAGFTATGGSERYGLPLLLAATGLGVAGLAGAVGLRRRRQALYPAVVVGVVVGIVAAVVQTTDLEVGRVAGVALVVVVLAGSVYPRLALSATGRSVPQAYTHDELVAEPDEVREGDVRADARRAHGLVLAVSVSLGVLVVLAAPVVVGLGVVGTVLTLCAAAVVMLRTQQLRVGREVGVGLALGVLALAVVAGSALVQHESWRSAVGVVLAVAGGVVLVMTIVPLPASVRRGRVAEFVEMAAVVAMLPLMVFAVGIVAAVTG